MTTKRSSKTKDVEQITADILEEAVGEPAPITPAGRRNPATAKPRRVRDVKGSAAAAKTTAKGKGVPLKKRKT